MIIGAIVRVRRLLNKIFVILQTVIEVDLNLGIRVGLEVGADVRGKKVNHPC